MCYFPIEKIMCASFWCENFSGVLRWSSPSKAFTNLFIATNNTVKFCIFTPEGFKGFIVKDFERKNEEGAILCAVCAWYNVWHWSAVTFKLVLVWNGLKLVLLKEQVSTKLSGAKGGFDRVVTLVVFGFSTNVWVFDLFGWIFTFW